MPGIGSRPFALRHVVTGYWGAAIPAGQILTEAVMLFPGRITGCVVYAATAGTGAGNTVMDVQINGVSVFSAIANRPTLLATATGEFDNGKPDVGTFRKGDVISLKNISISTTGQARVSMSVGCELV